MLETALAERLFAAYAQAGSPDMPRAPLLPHRLAETGWLLLFGGGAVALLARGLAWSGLVATAGVAGAAWGGWLLHFQGGILFDAAGAGLWLLLLVAAMAASWALALHLAQNRLRLAFADSLPRASIEKIARDPGLLKTEGEIRDCSYLVCGVRNLESLGATFRGEPATFTRTLSQLLSPLMDQALAHVSGDSPVTLFAVVGTPVLKASPSFRALTTFHGHIFQALRKQQWGQARSLIEQCRKLSGASPRLYDLHLSRIGYLESHRPGENWDGTFRSVK